MITTTINVICHYRLISILLNKSEVHLVNTEQVLYAGYEISCIITIKLPLNRSSNNKQNFFLVLKRMLHFYSYCIFSNTFSML